MKNDKHILNILKRIFFCTLCLSFVLGISSQTVNGTVSYVSALSKSCVNVFSGTDPKPTQPTSTVQPTTKPTEPPTKPTEKPTAEPTEPTETTVPTQPTTSTEPVQTTAPIPSSSTTQPSETSEPTTTVVPSESTEPTTVQPSTDATEYTTIPATVPVPFTNPTSATQPQTNVTNPNVPPKTGGASLDWYMLCILFSITGLAICWKLGKKVENQ